MIEERDSDQTVILLLGTLGHGKTRLLNTLCGTPFDSCMSAGSCTTTTQKGWSRKYNIQVVDTPGFFSSASTEQHTMQQKDALESSLLRGVYLVIKYGRVPEMAATASKIMDFVGDDDIRILITFVDKGSLSKEEETESVIELGKLLEVKTENIKGVGFQTPANEIEDFIESTLHGPRQFITSVDQQAYVNTLHVGAKKLFSTVDSICTLRKAKDVQALQTEILDEAAAFSAEDKVALIRKLENSHDSLFSSDSTNHYTLDVLSSMVDQLKGIQRSKKRKLQARRTTLGQDRIATHPELPMIPTANTIESGDPVNRATGPVVKRAVTEINSAETPASSRLAAESHPSKIQETQSDHDFVTLAETHLYPSPEEDMEHGHYIALDEKHVFEEQETQSDHGRAALGDSRPSHPSPEQEALRDHYVVPKESPRSKVTETPASSRLAAGSHPSKIQETQSDHDFVTLDETHVYPSPEEDMEHGHYIALDEKHVVKEQVTQSDHGQAALGDSSPSHPSPEQETLRDHHVVPKESPRSKVNLDKTHERQCYRFVDVGETQCDALKLSPYTWDYLDHSPASSTDTKTGKSLQRRSLQNTQQPDQNIDSLDAMERGEPLERAFNRLSLDGTEYQSHGAKRRRLWMVGGATVVVATVLIAAGRGLLASSEVGSDLASNAELAAHN